MDFELTDEQRLIKSTARERSTISESVNSRAVDLIRRCSSVSSKSIWLLSA